MRRRNDSYDRNAPEKKRAAQGVLNFFKTTLSVLISFTALCLLAYMFRLTSTEKDFNFRDFPRRLAQDIRRLDDPNTKMQIEKTLKDFAKSLRGLFSSESPQR